MLAPATLAVFGPLDWSIVGVYFALVILISFGVARKDQNAGEFFLANRNMPTWAVSVSLVATMLSTATFIGVPDEAFGGDISYLILNLGGFLAVFIVGLLFVPRLYHAGTVTIYGFLSRRFGPGARIAVSAAFIFGRFLASGARLFLAALPLCLLMFGAKEPAFWQIALAIALISLVGTFYATIGGVRAVVWVDTVQFAIVVGTALLSIGLLLHKIPMTTGEIFQTLGGEGKLHLFDASLALDKPYTFWTALIGNTLVMTAALGVDQDLAQRFLIAKSPGKGALSVIASQFISVVVVSLFLFIGLLLFVFYKHGGPGGAATTFEMKKNIYPYFLVSVLPTGLSGLAIAGFFAIAQGSLDSAMNALASSIVADIYVPLRTQSNPAARQTGSAKASKLTVACVGIVMGLFAILCAAMFDPERSTLLGYVLGIMTFAYAGMLGVFFTALFTKRGNTASVIAALAVGILTIIVLQPRLMDWWTALAWGRSFHFAWPWWMPIGTTIAFVVCVAGTPRREIRGFPVII